MTKKIVWGSIIATSAVILLGLLMVIPIFFIDFKPPLVILEFENPENEYASVLCSQVSTYLEEEGMKAVIFISGKFAESNPNCPIFYNSNIDIGSQTYNYIDLPKTSDYLDQLEEVKKGKEAVNKAGKLETKLFKAPYGETNDDIYSILNRAGIHADFSYKDHYNKFHDDKFLRFDLFSMNPEDLEQIDFSKLDKNIPIALIFAKSFTLEEVKETVEILKQNNVMFTNPSEITGLQLTVRSD